MTVFKKHWFPVIIVAIFLALIPLTWFKSGEMDLGGDSNRLYFYDPISYLKNDGLYYYAGVREGIRTIEPHFYNIPYVAFFIAGKSTIGSSHALLILFDIVKIVAGFLAVYAIIKDLIGDGVRGKYVREIAPVLGGLFYILSPGITSGWNTALSSHDQIFLYPIMLFLFLHYVLKTERRYLWYAIVISLVFSNSFSWIAAPPFFAFFPLSLLFVLMYLVFIRKKEIRWKEILVMAVVFLGLHAFHLIPETVSTFEPGNYLSTRVFDKGSIAEQVGYFYGVLGLSKPIEHLLATSLVKGFGRISVIPFVVILGFLFSKKNDKTYFLTGIFYLITYYLLTARITTWGVKIYATLFYIPGFSMFRNFIGQWLIIYYFFYALLFGQALFFVLPKLNRILVKFVFLIIVIILVANGWNFINGSIVKTIGFTTRGVRIGIKMDPRFEETLKFVRSLPKDSNVLTLPHTDCCYQVLHGLGDTAYIGPSTLEFLAGIKDINGYNNMAPFSEQFLKAAKDHDYNSIKRILAYLNIHYIFYNSDPEVYDSTFPDYPYGYVRNFLPKTQKEYAQFVHEIVSRKIFENGPYQVYSVDDQVSLPKFYTARQGVVYTSDPKIASYSKGTFIAEAKKYDLQSVFMEQNGCQKIFSNVQCNNIPVFEQKNVPTIRITEINPVKYSLEISKVSSPYMLVFSQGFHRSWKAYISDKSISPHGFWDKTFFWTFFRKSIPENRHIVGNAYANVWHILPSDSGRREDYEIMIEMTSQRIFYFGAIVSLLTVIVITIYMLSYFKTISGERTADENEYLLPTFFQHQKTYNFCRKYVAHRRVLDAGCGTGAGAFLLSKIAKKVVAIDTDHDAIDYSRQKYRRRNLTYKNISILDVQVKNKFDIIVSLQVIEHMEQVETYLTKIKEPLKPTGTAIFSTPNFLTQSYNENPYHVHEYTAEELLALLKRYFQTVNLYGLHGDKDVMKYERARKKIVVPLLYLDIFRLRYLLPKFIVQRLFDFATILSRRLVAVKSNEYKRISPESYKILKQTKDAIDLIAVCRRPR